MAKALEIRAAVKVLEKGGIVVVPTDTVYGLAANATDPAAVEKIYTAKGREFNKPLIVFIDSIEKAEGFAKVTPLAKRLAKRFLPGPLTLILDCKPGVLANNLTGKLQTIGIRIPGHSLALELTRACPFPLAVTSANPSGRKSPVRAAEVEIEADLVIDGGESPLGLESTIVDATGINPKFLRIGALSRGEIEDFPAP